MNWPSPIVGGIVIAIAAAIAGVFVFQDNITRFHARPKTPFQIAAPPPAPDYGARGAWTLWPDSPDEGLADVFYVHSTTYYSSAAWNASINDREADDRLRNIAAPNEAGPFVEIGALYAPRYRQATLAAFFTHKFDGVAARRRAYGDVKRAFAVFLEATDGERPIILVGYNQGGLHVQGVLQDFFQNDEDLRRRLAAAYVIGQATPLRLFETTLANTPPCGTRNEIRCVASYTDLEAQFDEEADRTRRRSMVWTASGDLQGTVGADLLCVNPLTWTDTGEYAGPESHLGAASATGLRVGEKPPPLAQAIGARCVNGVLYVDRPAQDFLRRRDWFGAKWRAQHFNLFYYDLADDARRRVQNLILQREEEYRFLAPIEESVDLGASPINKVPPH